MATTITTGELITAARLNALFAGLSDAGVFIGTITSTAAGPHTISAGSAGAVDVRVVNTTAGAAAFSVISLGNDQGAQRTFLAATSASFTPSAPSLADALVVSSAGAGGISVSAGHASGDVRVYTGGANLRTTWEQDGSFNHRTGVLREFRSVTTNSTDSNQTYTAAQMLGGIIVRSGMSVTRTDAVDTAANIVAAIPGAYVGLSFTCDVLNEHGSVNIDLDGASTGITYVGQIQAQAKAALILRIVLTNVGGGTEAATVYRIP